MISSAAQTKSRFGFAIVSILVSVAAAQAQEPSWIHEVSDVVNPRVGQFRIQTVASQDGHLVGSATYREKGRRVEATIDGKETDDGRFWPSVVVQAAKELNGPWQKLEQPATAGRPLSVKLKFYQANVILYLNLDVFRPVFGEMRYGRIILANGADTMFELNELLPIDASNKAVEEDWDRRTLWGYLEDPLASGPFVIRGISFREGRLIARSAYHDPQAVSQIIIEGTETPRRYLPEVEFWASATLQITNDPDGEWKTVGRAATPGTPAVLKIEAKQKEPKELSIEIGILRPMVGKFGYGRAVLPNGKSAAFEMIDLLPLRNKD